MIQPREIAFGLAGRVLFAGMFVECGAILAVLYGVGHWMYRRGRNQGLRDAGGLDADPPEDDPPEATPIDAAPPRPARLRPALARFGSSLRSAGTASRPYAGPALKMAGKILLFALFWPWIILGRVLPVIEPAVTHAEQSVWGLVWPGKRVMRRQLGRWPQAYRVPGAKPSYVLKARYRRPISRLSASNTAWLGAGGCCLWYLSQHPELQNGQGAVDVAISIGTFAWAGIYIVALNLTTKTLRLTVSLDGMTWRDAKGHKCRVLPDDLPGAECVVLPEHTRAEDERLTMQYHRRNDWPCYRIASEVMVYSGFKHQHSQQLAEIHKDRAGWKAKRLQAGFYAVQQSFAQEIVRRASTVEALRPLD